MSFREARALFAARVNVGRGSAASVGAARRGSGVLFCFAEVNFITSGRTVTGERQLTARERRQPAATGRRRRSGCRLCVQVHKVHFDATQTASCALSSPMTFLSLDARTTFL